MEEEREKLLDPAGHDSSGGQGGDGMRQRGVPQGRAIAQKMFQVFQEAEALTGVPTVPPDQGPGSQAWQRAEHYWEERHERKTKDAVKNKVEAVFWLAAAAFVLNSTDILHVMYRDDRVLRPVLNVALAASLVLVLCVSYLVVRVGVFAGVDWDKLYHSRDAARASKNPYYRPVCNAVGVGACAFCACLTGFPISLWPVWGWWTLPILFVLGMAMLMTMHFVPL
mmetsp:Transcript_14318/g.36562  ORF Transcript_14318/g.36562 Transcript_14318/m.36562 type:complete len:224 (-) Transcript_14318:6-677(-)